jgi:hypothetical protein
MERKILNPGLYTALVRRFGKVNIANPGDLGEYTCPPTNLSARGKAPKQKPMAKILKWGETYSVNCPRCGDTRQRLYISYFSGNMVSTSTTKCAKTNAPKEAGWFQFGNVYHCKNEGCHVGHEISNAVGVGKSLHADQVIKTKPVAYRGGLVDSINLPKNFPLNSTAVPVDVLQYVQTRHYSPADLDGQFDVRYMPPGVKMWENEEGDVMSWDHRLLIPITRAYKIIGWQARSTVSNPTSKKHKKYIFPPVSVTGEGKSSWLYNMAEASYHKDLVIAEGVTDVWRIGQQAVGSFGKVLSDQQIKILKMVWGSYASCVIAFDGEKEAWKYALEMENLFRAHNIFAGGVKALRLAEGYDPDNYTHEEINTLIHNARLQCQ